MSLRYRQAAFWIARRAMFIAREILISYLVYRCSLLAKEHKQATRQGSQRCLASVFYRCDCVPRNAVFHSDMYICPPTANHQQLLYMLLDLRDSWYSADWTYIISALMFDGAIRCGAFSLVFVRTAHVNQCHFTLQ